MSVKRKRSSETTRTNMSSQEIYLTNNYDETKENNLTNSNIEMFETICCNNNCVECVANTNNIHALNIKLETEVASRKALEESNAKFRKLIQNWAVEVFQCDPSNEDLDNLLSLEPENLFEKYKKIMKGTDSDRIKVEEATETLQDVKNKLKLQSEQREIYEKQLSEIRAVLHLPAENCNFANLVPVLKDLLEQNETNHCTNGLSIIESSSSHGRFSKRQKSDNSENSGNGFSSGEELGKKGKSGKGHECTQCNKTDCTAKGLKVHEKIHEVKKPMKCDICEYTFDSDKKMADHKKSVHAEMTQYESNICDTSFDKEKIAIHESKSNCSNSNLNSGTQSLKENEFRAKKQKTDIICPTCNKTFLKKNSLNVHIAAVHEGSKPFVCDFCKKRFPRKADMKKHISSVHQKNKEFKCTKCERKFARKHQVKDHIDLVHEKKKTYNCNICDKTFGSNSIMRRHVKLVHRERQ